MAADCAAIFITSRHGEERSHLYIGRSTDRIYSNDYLEGLLWEEVISFKNECLRVDLQL